MKSRHIASAAANFTAFLVLSTIIASPFFLAKNMTKVAGVKTEASYLISSQVGHFPNISFTQQGQSYYLAYTKYDQSQLYKAVLILTNPTSQERTYTISLASGNGKVFFGENIQSMQTQITLPPGTSTPISLYSDSLDNSQGALVEFKIQTQ